MNLNLDGRVAIVTGASKGIGLAIVKTLIEEGAFVIAGARTTSSLQGFAGVTPVAVDLTEPDAPGQLVQAALDTHGRLDVLVNNVGAVRMRLNGFLEVPDSEFEWSMQVNFFAALRAIRASLPAMIAQGAGAIVNVASVNAFFHPDSGVIDYGAAKAALVNASKALSQELGPKGIRINSVSPGPVSTDLWLGENGVASTVAKNAGIDTDTARANVIAGIGGFATGRFTTPEEVAALVAMLASDRIGNVTGSNYVIDGGLIKTL